MLTGSPRTIRKLWNWFGVQYYRVKEGKPADLDWWTHKPLTFDINHTDAVYPDRPARLPARRQRRHAEARRASCRSGCASLLDSEGIGNLEHPHLPWTADQIADDVLNMMGRAVPASQVAKVVAPSVSDARSAAARIAGRAEDASTPRRASCSARPPR